MDAVDNDFTTDTVQKINEMVSVEILCRMGYKKLQHSEYKELLVDL